MTECNGVIKMNNLTNDHLQFLKSLGRYGATKHNKFYKELNHYLKTTNKKLNSDDEITKEDAQFFKPLPENYEPVDTGVYLIWTTDKGIVRYYVSQHCVKDFVYWLDLTDKKDDMVYDPTINDVQKLLDWLYE